MKKTRRILGLGLAAAMMMSGAAGLADGVVLNDEGVTPIVKEGDVTLKIAVTQSADVVDYNNGNWLTDHLAEMLGGKIEVDVWPSTDAETKLTLMVTSGNELPDVLTFGADCFPRELSTPLCRRGRAAQSGRVFRRGQRLFHRVLSALRRSRNGRQRRAESGSQQRWQHICLPAV